MIDRPNYISKLIAYKDVNIIKVLTWIRRCGKSTILKLFIEYLKKDWVDENHLVFLNFEDFANQDLLDATKMHNFVLSKITDNKKYYVFLDEIQNVPNFQKWVDSLHIRENIDLYITGSNARFLSSDLATFLTGRYIQIKILPYSFEEYLQAIPNTDTSFSYQNYIKYWAFPQAVELFKINPENVREYIQSILDTVVYKDVIARYDIKNDSILPDLIKYLMDNVGNYTTAKAISDYLTSSWRPISSVSVNKYLNALSESFIIYPSNRFDIKWKRILQTQIKYYLVDMSFRSLLAWSVSIDYWRVLENVVFLELKRRYGEVWIGKNWEKEIDFIVKDKEEGLIYFQVALTVRDEKTLKRELSALNKIDNYAKFLLTLDPETNNYDWIKQVNALDWLLNK